jgi:hypothetical protein
MMYLVKLQFDPDNLIQAYCDNQGIPIEQCDLDVESILEQELGWLDASRVAVIELEEVKE